MVDLWYHRVRRSRRGLPKRDAMKIEKTKPSRASRAMVLSAARRTSNPTATVESPALQSVQSRKQTHFAEVLAEEFQHGCNGARRHSAPCHRDEAQASGIVKTEKTNPLIPAKTRGFHPRFPIGRSDRLPASAETNPPRGIGSGARRTLDRCPCALSKIAKTNPLNRGKSSTFFPLAIPNGSR